MKDLQKLRTDRGLTQFELAKRVGVSINSYIKWEKEVTNPNEENEKKLREVLQIEEK